MEFRLNILNLVRFFQARLRAIGFLFLFFHGFASFSFGAPDPVRLWNSNGQMEYNYNFYVYNLRQGSIIELSPGYFVTIQELIGKGTNTLVFALDNGKALRLPISDGISSGNIPFEAFIRFSFEGYIKLKDSGLPTPKLYEQESHRDRYLVVEKVNVHFTLEEFLNQASPDAEVMKALDEFALKTIKLKKVGDMHTGQVAYTDKGWLLLDFNSEVKYANSISDPDFFTFMKGLSIQKKRHFEKLIQNARKEAKFPQGSFLGCALSLTKRRFGEILNH